MLRQSFRVFLPFRLSRPASGHVQRQFPRMSSHFSHKNIFKPGTGMRQTRYLVSTEITDGNFFDEMDPIISEVDEIVDHSIENIRDSLYPKSESSVIKELNATNSLDELESLLSRLDGHQLEKASTLCQTIIIIWDIIRQSLLSKTGDDEFLYAKKDDIVELSQEFLNTQTAKTIFKNLEIQIPSMSLDELSCILMYLNKIGFAIRDPLLQKIISVFLEKVHIDPVTLTAASRFVVSMYDEIGLYPLYTCLEVLPYIYQHLDDATTSEDLRLVTIALSHVARLVSEDRFKTYQEKVKYFVATGVLNMTTVRANLKVLNFLNYPEWNSKNQTLACDLVLLMEPAIEALPMRELFLIQRNVKNRLEPAKVIPAIVRRADSLLESTKNAELLTCSLFETVPAKRKRLSRMAQELVEKSGGVTLPSLFKVLRLLKTADTELFNAYWDKVVEDIKSDQGGIKMFRHMHRYMHFNNNLGGTYRHRALEEVIMQILFKEIETGITSLLPSAFARAVSFMIAYGSHLLRDDIMPDLIFDRIEAMSRQFGVYDCMRISRGIQVAHELRYKFYIPTKEAPHLIRIEEILNNCVRQHAEDPTIFELNMIIKAYNARRSSRKSALFQKLVARYDTIKPVLSSRTVRDITYNLVNSNYHCPNIFEKIIDYTVQNVDYMSGETLEKIFTCFYGLGYVPERQDFFDTCKQIIERDFNFMSGLSIIQSCLALCYFKALPEELIERVFNINFIRRLEEEIESCYSKETYPERVLNNVMQLNRAVCLDVPQANVPWFQQNYIEAQMSKMSNIETRFTSDVKNLLISIVQERKMLKMNHVTPYGYKIEFVLHLKNNEIVQPVTDLTPDIQRIAVIPLRVESCCENSPNHIKGFDSLKRRHLEILGYKVVHINYREWNSMYMNVPGARLEYMKNCLGIS